MRVVHSDSPQECLYWKKGNDPKSLQAARQTRKAKMNSILFAGHHILVGGSEGVSRWRGFCGPLSFEGNKAIPFVKRDHIRLLTLGVIRRYQRESRATLPVQVRELFRQCRKYTKWGIPPVSLFIAKGQFILGLNEPLVHFETGFVLHLQTSIDEIMSVHYSPTTTQVSMATSDAESVIAAKRCELRVLWDGICPGDLSSPSKPQSTTGDDRTPRLRQLIKELQCIDRQRSRSYVEKLPDEVLYLVFSLTLSPPPLNLWYIEFESESVWGALDLIMVCTRWQAVMVSSPSLWSRLIIDREHFELDYLHLYLHLSHDHPLTLYWIRPNEEALLALKPHVHRIQHLYNLPGIQWCLEDLHDDATMAIVHPPLDTTFRIPTSSIISLDLSHTNLSLESIHCFQHLQKLISRNAISDLSLMPQHFNLPCLRILVLHEIRTEEPTSALRRFPVQQLHVLDLGFSGDLSYKEFTSLKSYIYQIPTLRSVRLDICPENEGWVEDPPLPELFSSTIQQVELDWKGGENSPLQFIAGIRSLERLSLQGIATRNTLPKYCLPPTLRELELSLDRGAMGMQEISLPCLEVLKMRMGYPYRDSLIHKLDTPLLIRLEVRPLPFFFPSYRRSCSFLWTRSFHPCIADTTPRYSLI